jgi:hypothetical protein
MRVRFSEIFRQNPDGSLEPLKRIRLGQVELGPGVRFTPGVKFGGIDIFQYFGHDFEASVDGDVLNLTEIYTGNSHLASHS